MRLRHKSAWEQAGHEEVLARARWSHSGLQCYTAARQAVPALARFVAACTTTMTSDYDARLTQGEARMWARRLRKLGFSPVTMHRDADGGYYLRCNWPFNLADAPDDLLPAFVTVDYGGYPEV